MVRNSVQNLFQSELVAVSALMNELLTSELVPPDSADALQGTRLSAGHMCSKPALLTTGFISWMTYVGALLIVESDRRQERAYRTQNVLED